MVPDVIRIAGVVDNLLYRHGLSNCIFAELYDGMEFANTLTWRFGTPYHELYTFAPSQMYIEQVNPRLYLWADIEPDYSVLDRFARRTKYGLGSQRMELPDDYILFLMQDPTPLERVIINKLAAYAEDYGTPVVFKSHPLVSAISTLKDSKYVYLADSGQNLEHLIRKSRCIITLSSSVALTACLLGKPAATLASTPFSEVIPQLDPDTPVASWVELPSVSKDDLARFLTWYTRRLCIDVHADGHEKRIEKRILDFAAGMTVQELLK